MKAEERQPLTLYGYWRSSAAYRVRIALNLKQLEYEQVPVNLVRDGGEQLQESYRGINPQGLVPVLLHGGQVLTQSMAICEYLDEEFPEIPLLPTPAMERARVRSLALLVACDIHPLNNLRVQRELRSRFGADEDALVAWMNHWMSSGFTALERRLQEEYEDTAYCAGDEPGLADCFLVPQVYNAERYNCDLGSFPRIQAVVSRCRAHAAFRAAAPEVQPDAPVA